MDSLESKVNEVFRSQKSLYEKIRGTNQLFLIHFCSLAFFISSAAGRTVLLLFPLLTGQVISPLSHRYGLFGVLVNIFQIILLIVLIIVTGIQLFFYGKFLLESIRSLRNIERADVEMDNLKPPSTLYYGIVAYVNNFYSFFSRYSSENKTLSDIVSRFLLLNFLPGMQLITLFNGLTDAEDLPIFIGILSITFLLIMVGSWIISLLTAFRIRTNIQMWESIFSQLEAWAQDLEAISSENSYFLEGEKSNEEFS